MRWMINGIAGVLVMTYPLAVYFGIQYLAPWKMAVFLMLLLGIRLTLGASEHSGKFVLPVAGLCYCLLAIWRNDVITLRFYPLLINALMLLVFAWSLASPPTVVERLARLQEPALNQAGVRYTRRVTQIWCVFFLLNGSIAFATAIWGSFESWSLYNGLIAYVLMGALMAGEYLVRMKARPHAR
ncbi:MAG: hypothetical protein ACU841_06120 [Gammaproteobacteria bacterium]